MRLTAIAAAGFLSIAWLPCGASAAQAPAFPTKPVRIVVTSAAGGAYDDVARAIGARLTDAWGQQVIVENRAGAGGIIGATTVARASPDGCTYFLGQIGVIVINPSLKSGRVRAIAIASAKRTPLLPDVPGVAETYPQFDVQGWLGLFAPTGTPAPIIAKVNRDMLGVLHLPAMRERLVNQGAEVIAGPPEQLAERMRADWPRYAELIKRIGLTAD